MNWNRVLIVLALIAAFGAGYYLAANGNGRYQVFLGEHGTRHVFDTRTGTLNTWSILGHGVDVFARRQPPGPQPQLKLDGPVNPQP